MKKHEENCPFGGRCFIPYKMKKQRGLWPIYINGPTPVQYVYVWLHLRVCQKGSFSDIKVHVRLDCSENLLTQPHMLNIL